MERGHISHISCGEQMCMECLEQEGTLDCHIYESPMTSNRHHHMPFFYMLLQEQSRQPKPSEPSSFQLLLRQQEERLRQQQLQHQWPLPRGTSSHWAAEIGACPRPRPLEPGSCVTDASEALPEARDHPDQHQRRSLGCQRNPTGAAAIVPAKVPVASTAGAAQPVSTEKKKRKRSRPSPKNVQEENQRMTHIAVERNRRKLMNSHLCSLRSLIPPSFTQRGDQASIVGGAIEYVKELEQLLQSLQAEKRTRGKRSTSLGGVGAAASPACSSVAVAADTSPFHDFFTSPQYCMHRSPSWSISSSSSSSRITKVYEEPAEVWCGCNVRGSAAGTTAVADIEVTVVHTHVNLKILSPRRPGQLQRVISAVENHHLSVLHLNITSIRCSVLYSFNLKIEEQCKLGSADEIAAAVHQIFSLINLSC